MGDWAGGGENDFVLLELVRVTEAVSLGAVLLPFIVDKGTGPALEFLAASHSAEPTSASLFKIKPKRNRAYYNYLVVPAEGAAQENIVAGEGGKPARRTSPPNLEGRHSVRSLGMDI